MECEVTNESFGKSLKKFEKKKKFLLKFFGGGDLMGVPHRTLPGYDHG